MTKRIISLLLCLPMLLSVMAPAVFATGNDNVIVIDDTITLSNVTIDGDVNDFVYVENSENTEDQPQETEPARIPEPEQETEPAVTEPAVTEPAVTEPAVTEPVAAKPVETEPVVMKPVQLIGEATATTKDGTTVSVAGIPKGGSVTVAPSTFGQVSTFAATRNNPETMIFAWDISVQDAEGADWQPEGTVQVEVDVPGVKLHKYTEVYVMHIDDEGNESRIEAEVTEDGKVAFETDGFSTFAGFTVDFAYEGVEFSIPGESSILLSQVFENLKAPLYIEDVVDVVFSDETLVTVTKVEGDWELTSLKAFTTDETLTITMNDGKVYVIDVTDAIPYPTITWRNDTNEDGGSNGAEDWTLSTSRKNGSIDNSHTEDYDIIVDGTGATNKTFQIVLQHPNEAATTPQTLYLDLHTIWVKGGANLVIRLGGTINNTNTKKIVITQVPGRKNDGDYDDFWLGELFWIENGSFELRPTYDNQSNVRIELDVQSDALTTTTYGGPKALVGLRQNATYLKLDQVDFKNCRTSAVVVRADELTEFTMTDCTFSSGCYSTGNAGGIYVRKYVEDNSATAVDIASMTLTNVDFNGTHAANHGGAMYVQGRVGTMTLTDCDFSNTYGGGHGGAISIANDGGATTRITQSLTLTNCTFTDTYINTTDLSGRGGAIHMNLATDKPPITFNSCKFTRCIAGSNGGAVSCQGVIGNFTIENGTVFDGCEAKGARGGSVSVACTSVGNITLSNSTFQNSTAGSLGGALHFGFDGATAPITAGAVSVTGCTFSNNVAHGVGGGLCLTDGAYASVTIQSSTFTDCDTTGFGGAIGMKVYKESEKEKVPFSVTGAVLIESCSFSGCDGGALGKLSGTWDHDGDPSTPEVAQLNGEGGGGAITISGPVGTSVTIRGTSSEKMKFENCNSWNNGGAIFFVDDLKTPKVMLNYLDIDGCRARDAGNAIYLSSIQAKNFYLYNSIIQNCTYFTPDFVIDADVGMDSGAIPADCKTWSWAALNTGADASGTIRTVGNTSTVAEINNCAFNNNDSYSNGGAVYWNANRNSTFSDNSTITTSLTIKSSNFEGNHAVRDGGALYCEATLTLQGKCEFKLNSADDRGGAIAQQVYNNEARVFQSGEATNLKLSTETLIHDNTAENGGGISITTSKTVSMPTDASFLYPVRFTLNGAKVYSNKATMNGGGIYYATTKYDSDATAQAQVDRYQKQINIDNGQIYSNIAGYGSGEGDTLAASETGGHGGGIYMSSNQVNTGSNFGYSTVNITGGRITKNKALKGNGGGIYLEGNNALCTITGGTIGGSDADKNEATVANGNISGNGGGIAISQGAKIEMTVAEGATSGGRISYNKAANRGGGIWLDKSPDRYMPNKITIAQGIIEYNNALNEGGGLSMDYRSQANLTGGRISYNTATNNGGGVFMYYYADLTLSGGTVEYNTATNGYGGGIYASTYGWVRVKEGGIVKENEALQQAGGGIFLFKHEAEITGGEIFNNKAYNGAGVCVVSEPAEGWKVTISGGSIHNNTATNNGGGVHNQGCSTLTINGGNIYSNRAVSGGGIYAEAGGTTTVSATETTAANIYSNTASSYGGGVYVNGSNFNMTGGKIEKNSANSGGGINAESNSTVTIKGGSIYKNTAGIDGGGIQIYNSATLNVKGGNIEENTANGNGGGIIVKNNSTATFVKEGDSVGFVVTNTAKNGGGVYVIGSSKLTFQEGYVVSNKAIGMPQNLATAYQNAEMLAGTGGGIFVADGTSTAKSEFAMTGTTDMGIYNNEASFAADDVYANNNNTKVVVPAVSKMNLSQYVGNPISWFEDYATNDTQYDHATALKNGTAMGIKSGYVFRYRKAPGDKRVEVQFTGDTLTLENKFVCMTLGVPTAIDDTVVIDYGLPVNIDVRANDLGMNEDVLEPGLVVSIGPAGGYTNSMTDTLNEGYTAEGSTTSKDVLVDGVRFGIANRVNDSTVCYTPTTMNVNKMATFTYALKYANKYFYANVNILPATSVYFEDSFTTDGNTPADNNSNRYMTFSGTGEWTQVGTTITDLLQTESRPGDGVKSDHIYGYDGAYDSKEMATYSMGSAMKAHVDEGEVASASFTFTGTGFDVISLTNSQTGTILVKVSQGDTVVKTYMVDTYYGYSYKYYKTTFTFTGGKWVPSTVEIPKKQMGISEKQPDGHPDEGDSYVVYSEGWAPTPGTTSLYQIPVIKADLVNYGTYNVEIKVAYSASFDHGQYADKGCDFYLDAIRIYNPMQNDKTANDTYVQDAENFPMYYELRNMLISANTFNGLNGEITGGAVFIDKNQSVEFPDDIGVADYINYGPNNEVYLGGFQAIAFNLAQSGDVASIQIGVKAPLTTGTNDYAWMKYGRAAGDKEKVVYSGTDLYVDITELNNGVVVIQNQANSVLAITNIKVTYNTAPVSAEPLNIFVDEASVNTVLKSLRRGAAAEQKPVLTASGATLSLESEILMNLYFQATNADQISTDDMGLLVWNQNPGAADFATADSVIPGALYDEAKGVYMVHSEGISGKKMGDSLYLAAYAKCADGSYVYTEPMEYSPKIYAMNRLAASQNENLKALLVAMLNYGAEAQMFFNYNADQLMNADLTAEQKALVKAYEASMMESPAAVDAAKAGTFGTETKGFANVGATMSAEGIFSINYYFTTANAVDQVTMYYWTKDAYDAADVLTADNASGSKVMTATSTENQVFASIDGIAAKDLDKTVYVCGVYEVDGETFTTGIIRYSLGVYCVNKAANGSEAMKPLATATAVYGYYAKVYFN